MTALPKSIPMPGFRPLPDDDDPLGQLDACHDRMRRQLATLEKLLARQAAVAAPAVDDEVRAAATAIGRYFDEAATRHHHDEEQDLFPAVIEAMAGSDAVCLKGMVERLTNEHRQLEGAWRMLRPSLAALAASADGAAPGLDTARAAHFVAALRDHITYEDEDLLPMARRLLSDAQVGEIGQGMRARRGRR